VAACIEPADEHVGVRRPDRAPRVATPLLPRPLRRLSGQQKRPRAGAFHNGPGRDRTCDLGIKVRPTRLLMPSCTFTWCSRTVEGVMESIEARAYPTEWPPFRSRSQNSTSSSSTSRAALPQAAEREVCESNSDQSTPLAREPRHVRIGSTSSGPSKQVNRMQGAGRHHHRLTMCRPRLTRTRTGISTRSWPFSSSTFDARGARPSRLSCR
jgi:hypothetical protein